MLSHRRAVRIKASSLATDALSASTEKCLVELDEVYRGACALLYNYVPTSGHPGGAISSGRFVQALLFLGMDYDLGVPDRPDADIVSYAAGHKAMGLYALWALRDEIARVASSDLLPRDPSRRLRIEDLIGFRRNPAFRSRLATRLSAKALDGHPTPGTPFVRLATGASGVGVASSFGLALGAADYYGADAPRVHVVEGEGGLTPGRVAESLAMAGTAGLDNVVLHLDWNQASIDSDHVCREGSVPGEYVQWDPRELFYLHDWNVIDVDDGFSFPQIVAAQRAAAELDNGQPTAIVYRTTKGWQYGVEGRASHGAGHALCSEAFFSVLTPLVETSGVELPHCHAEAPACGFDPQGVVMEDCLWEALTVIRQVVLRRREMVRDLGNHLAQARERLQNRGRRPRDNGPRVEEIFRAAQAHPECPEALRLEPGGQTTLRGELGRVLNHYNVLSGGALLGAAADLLSSTSLDKTAQGFPPGFWHRHANPESRLLAIGGICEDAISGVLTGLSSFGQHIGAGSSYGAFMAPLGHISARLHAIGNQARAAVDSGPFRPTILVCGHAGLKTGEDGPTHADPQALQLLQDNFPLGTMITLTPWDPQEVWPLVTAALAHRPAVIAPFVTRPSETVPDRRALGLAPAARAAQGVYYLRDAHGPGDGTVVLQGSEVAYAFLDGALARLDAEGVRLNVVYVASSELFDLLPESQRRQIFPEELARDAMGITGFTLPTLYRWVTSELGRECSLHPYRGGHYLGSGPGPRVVREAGLDGHSQFEAVVDYVTRLRRSRAWSAAS